MIEIFTFLIIALTYYLGHQLCKLRREVRIMKYKNLENHKHLECIEFWFNYYKSLGEPTPKWLLERRYK
jgi:hypothetical protein